MNGGVGRASDATIDPELIEQLNSGQEGPVEAVVQLRSRPTADPAEVSRMAQSLIERAEQQSHQRAISARVFAYLGVIGVVALPVLIRELLKQPEVLSATVPQHIDSNDSALKPVRGS
jgi:hypothetical protein